MRVTKAWLRAKAKQVPVEVLGNHLNFKGGEGVVHPPASHWGRMRRTPGVAHLWGIEKCTRADWALKRYPMLTRFFSGMRPSRYGRMRRPSVKRHWVKTQ